MVLLKGLTTKYIIGLDLGNLYSQISYSTMSGEELKTISLVAGETGYNIPTLLCKRKGINQWFFGREALRCAGDEEWLPVENLLELARERDRVTLDGESFATEALLALFVKRSLGLLSVIGGADRIGALMVTCPVMDASMLRILKNVVEGLHLKTDRIHFQSYTESFYQYVIHQPQALWEKRVLLMEYERDNIWVYHMDCNRNTTPIVAFIDKEKNPFFDSRDIPQMESLKKEREERMDAELVRIAGNYCTESEVSMIFLIGEGYERSWMKKSLAYLCGEGRRVFQGSNLYSRGACMGMYEKLSAGEKTEEYVYLGNDKLKANVGMKVLNRGKEAYMALLDGGSNWFEAEETVAFYLREEKEIELIITPLTGQPPRTAVIELEGLSQDEVRIHMHLRMLNEELLSVTLTEQGFGDIFPASYREWNREIALFTNEEGRQTE